MILLTSPSNGPGAVRRFLLPGLFVLALFVTLYMRRPVVENGDVQGTTYSVQTKETYGRDQIVISGATMGTTYTVKVALSSGDTPDQEKMATAVAEALAAVNASMSTYQSESELSRLNETQSPEWLPVSAPLSTVLGMALDVAKASEGAFDPTIGPVVNAWGFGPNPRTDTPSDDELTALKSRVGWTHLELDRVGLRLKKAQPAAYIDLSAVAKGYGVDRVAEILDAHGAKDYLVEVGGELRAKGVNTVGVPWRVGIESPDSVIRGTQNAIGLADVSMATSGDYRNYREVDGQRISHTIDPRTLKPITHRLASVTVVAKTCAEADAWATALNVLGPDDGVRIARAEALAAYFLVKTADGSLEVVRTEAFQAIEDATQVPSGAQ